MRTTGVAVLVASMLLACASGAPAQVAVPGRPGITVLGRGAVRRPADVVRFAISLLNNGGRATPSDALAGADALVRALKTAGIDDAAVANPTLGMLSAQRVVSVVGSLRKPTLDRVRALMTSVEGALPSGTALQISNVNVSLALDDCTPAIDSAEKAALDDARKRAQRLAADAGVSLGAITSLTETDTSFGPSCPAQSNGVFIAGPGQFDPFATATALDVVLTANATVTFEIR